MIILCIIIIKNVNNLLIEIGPIAVKAFILDLKNDLLEANSEQSRLGPKKDLFVKAIDKFCAYVDSTSESLISNKVGKLVEILVTSYEKSLSDRSFLKTIIFVKDRSVAVYLKKILAGTQKDYGDQMSEI